MEKLQSELYVTKNVNTLLSNEIDDLQQYQRQHCILIDGLRTSPSETSDQVTEKVEKVLKGNLQFDPEEVNCQIDACHRIEPINTKDGMQSTIVRFKTHFFREAVYLRRRKCNKKQKIKLSLTQRRRKTLTYAYNNSADKSPGTDFYRDIHGNLKFCLKNPINNKFAYVLKAELLNLFKKFGWDFGNFDVESEGGLAGDNEEQD